MRETIAVLAGLVVLGWADWTVVARERLLADGRVVLLDISNRDPRSIMQGDYMALRFRLADLVLRCDSGPDGRIVVSPDARGVAEAGRCDDGRPLAAGEIPLRYRMRANEVRFATNAFFFEEGRADDYARARWAEFRVAPSGDMLLTGLRDAQLEPLGPSDGR